MVACINPLHVFMYKDGLVRLSTLPYEAPSPANVDQLFMHLTNYAINKQNEEGSPPLSLKGISPVLTPMKILFAVMTTAKVVRGPSNG